MRTVICDKCEEPIDAHTEPMMTLSLASRDRPLDLCDRCVQRLMSLIDDWMKVRV